MERSKHSPRKLAKYLANLGYGSRRDVEHMLRSGRITGPADKRINDSDDVAHHDIRVDGLPLDPPPGTVIMLHKPTGYVCSTTDSVNPVVYDLLPPRFRLRSPLMATIGRLDADTSGLLLFSDDGQINHRITSPRHHHPRTYDVTLHSDLRGDEAELFASGTILLKGETTVLAPAILHVIGPRHARVIVTEGRYHQIRRMFAAFDNHVVALHRCAIGSLALGDLPPAQWRVLSGEELALID